MRGLLQDGRPELLAVNHHDAAVDKRLSRIQPVVRERARGRGLRKEVCAATYETRKVLEYTARA